MPEPLGSGYSDIREKLFRSVNNLEKTVIALGFFDGVHRGHGALLRKTAERARELGLHTVLTRYQPMGG